MANLRPFRDYDEKDVINLFALDVTGIDLSTWDGRVTKGTLVSLSDEGWKSDDELDLSTSAGAFSPAGVTSQRYMVQAKVEVAAANTDVLGMLLHDVAEYDENGEQLKFNPRKASELEAAIPGQAVPIVTRGIFLVDSALLSSENANAGSYMTAAANGDFTTSGVSASADHLVGRVLGKKDSNGFVLIQLNMEGRAA